MVGNDEDQSSSRRHGAEYRGWSSTGQVLSAWTIERSGDAVCDLYYVQGDEERGFLNSASKPRLTVSPGLTSKLVATVLMVWPQNHSLRFSSLGLKTGSCGLMIWPTKSLQRFLSLGLKTKWEDVCQVAPQNRREDENGVGHTLRYSDLLHLEVSWARISQSSLKTGEGTARMVHVASSQRLCGDEVEEGRVDVTGCIRLFYPNFIVSLY
jgi:hypothetical protein